MSDRSGRITVTLYYDAVMGEVGRVLRDVQERIRDQAGEVWVAGDDVVEGREDSDFETVQGWATVDIEATSRQEAHNAIIEALNEVDPQHDVVVGGDVFKQPIDEH